MLRDLFDNYWVLMPVKALVIIALVLTCFLVIAYMEHKVMGHMQARLGRLGRPGRNRGAPGPRP
jgi:NADH:ubiquinone oxidoreductase subunit H